MPLPLEFIPSVRRYRKRQLGTAAPVPPVLPLDLILGNYDPGQRVELLFNQAIDISGVLLGEFIVDDGSINNERYRAIGVYQDAPEQMVLQLEPIGFAELTGVHLLVGADNGVVPAAGGPMWASPDDVPLPYPS